MATGGLVFPLPRRWVGVDDVRFLQAVPLPQSPLTRGRKSTMQRLPRPVWRTPSRIQVPLRLTGRGRTSSLDGRAERTASPVACLLLIQCMSRVFLRDSTVCLHSFPRVIALTNIPQSCRRASITIPCSTSRSATSLASRRCPMARHRTAGPQNCESLTNWRKENVEVK